MPIQTLDNATSVKLAAENPDYGIQKLFEAIENKQHPSWTVYVVSRLNIFLSTSLTQPIDCLSKR